MPHFVRRGLILAAMVLTACSDQARMPTSPLFGAASAAKASPAPTIVNVTSTLYDADGLGNLLLTRSDDYNGTGFATYTTTSNSAGTNGVNSHVTSAGWQVYLGNQTQRTVYLVLASQGIGGISDGFYYANVEVYSKCFDQNNNQIDFLAMTAGSSNGNCAFGVDFSSGKTKYKLAMSPVHAGTGRAVVTCNAAASGTCTSWTIVPNVNVANTGVANLYQFTNSGLALIGAYHSSYSATAAQ